MALLRRLNGFFRRRGGGRSARDCVSRRTRPVCAPLEGRQLLSAAPTAVTPGTSDQYAAAETFSQAYTREQYYFQKFVNDVGQDTAGSRVTVGQEVAMHRDWASVMRSYQRAFAAIPAGAAGDSARHTLFLNMLGLINDAGMATLDGFLSDQQWAGVNDPILGQDLSSVGVAPGRAGKFITDLRSFAVSVNFPRSETGPVADDLDQIDRAKNEIYDATGNATTNLDPLAFVTAHLSMFLHHG